MAIKYEQLTLLYEETIKRISRDEINWIDFLKSACRNYRLSFSDMVLIYAQRPDAKAVLEMEQWNKRYGLWIKQGSKGIAVFDPDHSYARIKYYFDIADTRKTKLTRPVPIWSMKPEYEQEVINTLKDKFSIPDTATTLEEVVISACNCVVEDNVSDYLIDINYCKENSLLEELDEQNLEIIYKSVLTNSIAYSVLTRCDRDADLYINEDDLRLISQFNTPEILNAVGVSTRDMTQMIIGEIRIAVLNCIRQPNRTFELGNANLYNETDKDKKNEERRMKKDEDRIHSAGRLSDSKLDTQTRGQRTAWEIRIDEKTIPQGASSDSVYELPNNTDSHSAFDGNRQDSQSKEGIIDKTVDGTARSERAVEGSQSDVVDSNDEQHRRNSQRDYSQGTDIQLNPNENMKEAGQFEIPAFFTQDELDALFKFDRFNKHKNKDVQKVFELFDDLDKRIAYLKETYTPTIIETIYQNTHIGFQRYDEKDSLRVWKDKYTDIDKVIYMPWKDVVFYIEDMMNRNIYVSIPSKSIPTINDQQLNLFDMEPIEPSQNKKDDIPYTLPQYIIDAVLFDGINTHDNDFKVQVTHFMALDRSAEKNAEHLKEIYKKGMNGFIINNRQISYQWNEKGMVIAIGDGIINAFEKQTLSWKDVAKGIRHLLDDGRYISQHDLQRCEEVAYKNAAETLWLMYQDIDYEKYNYIPSIKEYYHKGFPDGTQTIKEKLKDNDFYLQIMTELNEFKDAFLIDPHIMRYKRFYNPLKVIPVIERLKEPRIQFKTDHYREEKIHYFITQDKIDSIIANRNDSTRKYDIYSFFLNHSNKKERIKFLKKMWGISGANDYSSDSKGLKIKYGYSMIHPEVEVVLKWNDVEKRISYLIAQNKFLDEAGISGLDDYEREKIARDISSFYARLPLSNIRPYNPHEDYWNIEEAVSEIIKDRTNLPHIIDLMQIALDNTAQADENYQNMVDILENVKKYHDGTFTLFNRKKTPLFDTPYVPITNIYTALAVKLDEYMKDFDFYDYLDDDDKNNVEEVTSMLHDISALGDTIQFLNANINEDKNEETVSAAKMLREELATLYAMHKGSNLADNKEFKYSYAAYITQDKPIYNTGDFVFLYKKNQPLFGTIELIENDSITINLFDFDIQGESYHEDIELGIDEFENMLAHDYRNEYLYNQNRPLLRPPHQIKEDDEDIFFEDTFSYKNFMLLRQIAPIITNDESNHMEFVNADDEHLVIAFEDGRLKIGENLSNDNRNSYEFQFQMDSFETTLDIREITIDNETYAVPLINGEVNDYEIELQMNEEAHDFLKSLFEKDYYLQNFEVNGLGKNFTVEYQSDGNIIYFNGNDEEYQAFMEHYGNEPLKNISCLVPLNETGKDKVERIKQVNKAKENFKLLQKIAPLIVSGESNYMKFVAGEHMMPLTIEMIDENRIAMSHHYELNGDMMADPDMEFVIDIDNETLSARTYQQDSLAIYQEVEVIDNLVEDIDLENELNDFANQWLHNIISNDYYLEKLDYYSVDDMISITYGSDGLISEFSGSDEDLDYFRKQYDDDSHNRVSILVANHDEDEEQIIETSPTQKETEITEPQQMAEKSIYKDNPSDTPTLFSDVETAERYDYHITDYDLGIGGPKEKYKANVKAIQLLKSLENEKRLATPDEQDILSRYVGWGGLPDVFDETKDNWKNEYQELKELLNDDEYRAARESTLTAFYTPPLIIETIYKKLTDLGFTSGNVLEPSCGIGNFMGMKPDNLDCQFYGVELDKISGRIARQLYQNASITIQGFEKTDISDNFFDAVIGNVPYGQLPVHDPRYNQHHFMIHDYFFAKALDKVKIGGIVIFLTSKFTMDKKTNDVRKYISQRARLLGAIRLPDNAFKANAETKVTTDILILQKLEKPLEHEPEWINVAENEDRIVMNTYFIEHPEMVLGTMIEETSQYGMATACKANDEDDLKDLLENAMSHVHGEIDTSSLLFTDEEDQSIPADPQVRNFSYCIHDGLIYYRENSRMYPMELSKTAENRVRSMIAIRDSMRTLINLQTNDYPEKNIKSEQNHLNSLYDSYVQKYGLINSRGSRLAFQDDSSYSLICSLEILNNDGTMKRKADIFNKRTIKPRKPVQSVDTASEALIVSMAEKGRIDFDFMTQISNISHDELIEKLQGVIFPNPVRLDSEGNYIYETSDEYLSGDVREKLVIAQRYANGNPIFKENVKALKEVQPEKIKAGDISVRLGTTWIPTEIYNDFIYELLDTPTWRQNQIKALYVSSTQEWNITHKSVDGSIKATKTYGTHRINAYKIIESTLNLRDVKIFDKKTDNEGKEIRILNKKETAIALSKQDLIKSKFVEWVWSDPERREMLCDIYNEKFNSIRNRTYDGSHLQFYGMNPDITLRKHQVDAVARILYGGNTLLAHCVGAGKTFAMIAAGMESKRLGFSSKPLYVVPNNIIGDFASDFYRLYPSANILVATTDTLSKANRHKFFSRIASGDWDGVIITHSQFIKMPISIERQIATINRQVEEISSNIQSVKENHGERFTVKQLEQMKKKLEAKLEKLNDQSKKDDILCFEQLGIDMLFVDEADLFKNLFLYSKMSNVSGISQRDSQRASDLFMKTQYLDELTNYRGVVFATGTPVSNSMAELYTMQRYLQYNTLQKYGLEAFDSWASTFGETVTAMELSPEGKGFKLKTRFAKFYNLPELMTMFREVADIQTEEMLKLPVPKMINKIISVPPTDEQKAMVEALGERAEKVRNRKVEPQEDNMLLITNDGRKLALDQRIINPLLPDNPNSKLNACVNNIYEIWEKNKDKKLTQIMFCDLSTPNGNKGFNVYDDIRNKLIEKGIPEGEVQHVHVATTEKQKQDLFAKVRNGKVRIINGSTSKMGAGTNVQDLLVALHDLDCPWRPRDLEQRHGRIKRQGNQNDTAYIYTYVTEGTFDAYLYQIIEKKQTFISQVFTNKTPQRTMEEIDETVLNYAEIKAIACGDPKIMERCNLEVEVNKLNMLKASYLNQKYELQDYTLKILPAKIKNCEEHISQIKLDIAKRNEHPINHEEFVGMTIDGTFYKDKKDAGNALFEATQDYPFSDPTEIGEYCGFHLAVSFDSLFTKYYLHIHGNNQYLIELGTDKLGNLTRLNNVLNGFEKTLTENEHNLEELTNQMKSAKLEIAKPFSYEKELEEKTKKLEQLTMELKLDEKDSSIIDAEFTEKDMDEEEKQKGNDLTR